MVESQLRNKGVTGEIRWNTENASGAARSKKKVNSDSTEPLEQSAISAKSAAEKETPKTEPQTPKSSGTHGTGGTKQTPDDNGSLLDGTTKNFGSASSQHTEASASVVEKWNQDSSPLTISTEAEHNTEKSATERSTPNFDEMDSRRGIASFAGIATGLTGSMATVCISMDSSGTFLWPKGLPKFVHGSPMTVAENVLAHGTGALNVDGCRVGTDGGTTRSEQAPYAESGWRTGHKVEALNSGRWPVS